MNIKTTLFILTLLTSNSGVHACETQARLNTYFSALLEGGKIRSAQALIDKKPINLDALHPLKDETPLMTAVRKRLPYRFVKQLIDLGVDKHKKNAHGKIALDYLSSANDLGILFLLTQKNPLTTQQPYILDVPLTKTTAYALEHNCPLAVVQYLVSLSKKYPKNAPFKKDAYKYITTKTPYNIAQYLFSLAQSPESERAHVTYLYHVLENELEYDNFLHNVFNKKIETITPGIQKHKDALLEYTLNQKKTTYNPWRAQGYEYEHEYNLSVIEFLVAQGAAADPQDKDLVESLLQEEKYGDLAYEKSILQNSLSFIETFNSSANCPESELLKRTVGLDLCGDEHHLEFDRKSLNKANILIRSIRRNYSNDLLHEILDRGINVNIRDKTKKTALDYALKNGRKDLAKDLREYENAKTGAELDTERQQKYEKKWLNGFFTNPICAEIPTLNDLSTSL